jgi:hypothetical protein
VQNLGPTYPLVVGDPHHSAQVVVDILSDPSTVTLPGVPFTAGNMTLDRTATIRRQSTATVVDDDWARRLSDRITPAKPGDPLTPYGSIMRPTYYVWSYTHPAPIAVPIGLYRIADSKTVGDGTIALTCYDFSRVIQRNKLTAPYVVPAGTNYVDAICDLAMDRLGTLYNAGSISTTQEVAPLMTFDAQDDPWQHITEMASAIGFEAFFDALGQFTLQQVQDPGTAPVVWSYVEGDTMLIDADIDRTDDPGPNGVQMVSESSILPVPLSSTVWDTNPSSPTYYLGPYGMVPDFQSSSYIGTQAQCDAAANKWLIDNLGGTEQATFSAVPNPAHEGGDAVHLTHSRDRINDVYALDSFQLSYRVTDPMSVSTKSRRSLSGLAA